MYSFAIGVAIFMLAFIFVWCALCYRLFSDGWDGWLPVTVVCAAATAAICGMPLIGFYLTR